MNHPDLPIEQMLPELRTALRLNHRLVLQAPPGAGKTTRVPLALLDQDWLNGQSILMLEPRRLAAANAASFMAAQLGEPVGRRVGFTIRYQRKISAQTRIEVVTEGILTRRLQQDPELRGVGLVIFDEFHERHLQSDLALALCCDAQQGLRPDLRLLVMSATLDGEPLSRLLEAPLLSSEGRSYPVEIRYLSASRPQNMIESVLATSRRALKETVGDLLVFLPGEMDIRRCQAQLNDLAEQIDLCPLFAHLPYAEQERAILPGSRRKLVLATNIAETSLTIQGIEVVIDSGYCKRPRYDHGSGLTRLELCRISRASADQRAGRAGRLRPGICYRLWSEGAQGALLPFSPPEIRSADLAPLTLELLHWGVRQPDRLTWLDPPPEAAWNSALALLELLGAITPQGGLTAKGGQLVALPAHPRIGCLLLRARQQGLLPLGCDLAALLAEADPWFSGHAARQVSRSDILDRLEEYWKRLRQGQLQEFQAINRAARYWRNCFHLDHVPLQAGTVDPEQIADLLFCAYPDRLGKRRPGSRNRYLLSSGQGAELAESSALQQEDFLLAVDLQARTGAEARIGIASAIDKESLPRLFPDLPWSNLVFWDTEQGRVLSCARQMIGSLPLAERPAPADPLEIRRVILGALKNEGLGLLNWSDGVRNFLARSNFLQRTFPEEGWPDLSEPHLRETLEEWLSPLLGNARNRADLQKIDLLQALRGQFDWQRLQRLEKLAPERYQVPSGSLLRLQYPPVGPPVLAVKLQEMFGQSSTPRIAAGRCPLLIHLLSPAGRPLQITQDLPHFWEHCYPDIRKEMKGRYPKHPWPENPLLAPPTARTKRS